jgi:hypothetical protein
MATKSQTGTTTLLSIASRQYAPQIIGPRNVTMPSGKNSVLISLTRESWPTGVVINTISLTDPSGNVYASNGIVGGVATYRDGTVRTTQDMEIQAPTNADGTPGTLPGGTWQALVDIAQTITTAVSVISTP